MKLDEILTMEESQTFDRKSVNIAPRDLSSHVCAFANADGGIIAIGISDRNRRIEGVDSHLEKINELLRVPMDFCTPTVPFAYEFADCIDGDGNKNHILLLHIEASAFLHENQSHDAYVRVGDKSKLLSFEDRMTLSFDKGLRTFEDFIVPESCYGDIDENYLGEYLQRIGYTKSPKDYLLQNKNFAKVQNGILRLSVAAILLFAKNPQSFFPRARVRFIRYEGKEEKFGTEMNVVKDVVFEGRILQQIQKTVAYIQTQIKERTYLTSGGIFTTKPEYPEFVRTELVVNAVTHRDYSIRGTEIQIKMFDEHLVVESPGNLPSIVKIDRMRETHFARNAHIAEYLKCYKYVKDFGEGVDRMCREMEESGLPKPEFKQSGFILEAVVKNTDFGGETLGIEGKTLGIEGKTLGIEGKTLGIERKQRLIDFVKTARLNSLTQENILAIVREVRISQVFGSTEVQKVLDCAPATATNVIKKMKNLGVIVPVTGRGKGKYKLNADEITFIKTHVREME